MIILGLIFIVLSTGIKYGKMYYLIAGYNTMSKAEKAKVDIQGVASLMMKVFGAIGIALIIASILIDYYNAHEIEGYVIAPIVISGTLWLVIRSNSKKYRINR